MNGTSQGLPPRPEKGDPQENPDVVSSPGRTSETLPQSTAPNSSPFLDFGGAGGFISEIPLNLLGRPSVSQINSLFHITCR